ncbi:enoyl-CoA hydratase/isomerase family protein [Microbacterium sp. NPDC056044]|uniref:enoyl-CoA hydratase/isomerase family protein n=1 Tax=Microbacterium sp. NPDC056044 TaxID=3345690 RepID=UPI0035DA58A3
MPPTVQTASEVLAERLARPAPLAYPATAIRLDDGADLLPALESLRARQHIVIGVLRAGAAPPAEVLAACDLVLAPDDRHPSAVGADDVDDGAERVLAAIARNPHAATVLADVLRATESASVVDALHVESLAYSALLAGSEFAAWLEERPTRPVVVPDRPPVRVQRSGDELRLTLDHPERRNAYSAAMRDGLVDALGLAEADDTIARIVLAGAGPSFCAGGDLAEFGTNTDGAETHLLRTRGGAAAPLHRLASRVEAVVHGHCIGAGIELPAFAATVRVQGDAVFRLPEVQMGLIPGAGGTVSIPRRIGRHRTFWLAVTGTAIDTATALRWGLADAALPAP